jgi:tetratricopeptide (TPR) repeat protein
MKKFIAALGLAFIGGISSFNAQVCPEEGADNYGEDSLACRQGVSYYSEFLRQENWKEASISWWKAQKICPQYKVNMYNNGVQIYGKLIKDLKNENSKDPNIVIMSDTIDMIYVLWAENFGDCFQLQIDRADNLMRYQSTTDYEKANELYRKGFSIIDKTEIGTASAQYFYMSSYYMVRNKKAECTLMLTDYDLMDSICQENIKKGEANSKTKTVDKWIKVQGVVDQYLAPCATPEVLIEMAKKQISEDPTNLELKKKWIAKLSDKNATDFPEFITWIVDVDAAEPSAQSKMFLGDYYYKEKDYNKALDYYDEAVQYSEVTAEQKLDILKKKIGIYENKGNYKTLYSLGGDLGGCEGKYAQARAVVMSVSSCATKKADIAAIYTYALKIANDAGSCVPSSRIESYTAQLPTKSDLFLEGIKEGDVLDVPCWNTKIAIKLN